MLDVALIDSLFPEGLPDVDHWLRRYPQRTTSIVTRFAPSPTGHLHIGGVYAALISQDLARHGGGVFFVRIEDTDRAREVPGAADQFARALDYFRLTPEPDDGYGPYTQSARAPIYLSFVRQLLRTGYAYLCFATKQELAELAARQVAAKVPTGYYGPWAPWRDATSDAVRTALDAGKPYVVRFRVPEAAAGGRRFAFQDAIRGRIELDDNRTDAVLLKSGPAPLPTYHLAHAVDDSLMGVTLVVRGEEWLSSVPLHHQLFAAIGRPPVRYAHIALLLKRDGRSKRKLSKRMDPEASVDHYLRAGYPVPPLLHYLRGLANGRLAELPTEQALTQPLRLEECGVSGALVDLVKLDDMCNDFVASMPGAEVVSEVTAWAREHDPELADALARHPDRALAALAIEREGVPNPRKDLRRWEQFRDVYGYFLPTLFTRASASDDPRVRAYAADVAGGYFESAERGTWFDQIRAAAARHGLGVRDAAQIVRVALTGSTRSPDLHAVAMALGRCEVVSRLSALAHRGES